MFGRSNKNQIVSLISPSTTIEGDVHFKGGLRIEGKVIGNVIAEPNEPSMLVICDAARIEGEVRVSHLIVNGEIEGPVHSTELLELQPKARIVGDVHYKALEMHGGALVTGKLTHHSGEEPLLKLATA